MSLIGLYELFMNLTGHFSTIYMGDFTRFILGDLIPWVAFKQSALDLFWNSRLDFLSGEFE